MPQAEVKNLALYYAHRTKKGFISYCQVNVLLLPKV